MIVLLQLDIESVITSITNNRIKQIKPAIVLFKKTFERSLVLYNLDVTDVIENVDIKIM